MGKLTKLIKNNWRDITALSSVALLTIISVRQEYHLGMLVGFILIFVFFSYQRIKRIITELNIKKIFGVEFGEYEKQEVADTIKKELKKRGAELDDLEVEKIADIALNRIQGVAYKGRYYEEMVDYALTDLGKSVRRQVSGAVGGTHFTLDFLVELDNGEVIGIEVVYSDRQYLGKNKIAHIRQAVNAINNTDNFVGFLLITNSEVRESDMHMLEESPKIELISKTVSPGGVLSRLSSYFRSFDEK